MLNAMGQVHTNHSFIRLCICLLLLICCRVCSGQSCICDVTFKLDSLREGTLELFDWNEEGEDKILFKKFYGENVRVVITENCERLDAGLVIKYRIVLDDGSVRSYFFPGSRHALVIDTEGLTFTLDEDHPYHLWNHLVQQSGKQAGIDSLINEELLSLRKRGLLLHFTDYLIYYSVANRYMSFDHLDDRMAWEREDSYWLGKLLEHQRMASELIDEFDRLFDSLNLSGLPYGLVKFWGQWCAPCRRDNLILDPYVTNTSDHHFFVLGVQNDQKRTPGMLYPNILDPDRRLSRHFGVNAYPFYIIFQDKEILFESADLQACLEWMQDH